MTGRLTYTGSKQQVCLLQNPLKDSTWPPRRANALQASSSRAAVLFPVAPTHWHQGCYLLLLMRDALEIRV